MANTWTEIQDFPEGICITDVEVECEQSVAVRTNAFSYKQEVQIFSGERWSMSVNFKPLKPACASKLESFLLKLRGQAGTFRFGDPYHSCPQGRAIGTPVVSSATAGSQTVETSGWLVNTRNQLIAGDYIQIGERLYRVLDDVDSDVSGNATITIKPSLRESYTAGEEVVTINPTGLFRLSDSNNRFSRQAAGQRHNTTINMVEAL